jgi:hypothetical protein
MDLRETGWGSVEWIHSAQDRDRLRALVATVMNRGLWRHGVGVKAFSVQRKFSYVIQGRSPVLSNIHLPQWIGIASLILWV